MDKYKVLISGKNPDYFLRKIISNKINIYDICKSYNELIIEPKPDSLLRLTMHIKKVNKKVEVKEQKLPTFERTGFVAVEWGGIQY